MIENTFPINHGFYMPAEFSEHRGCIIIWPEREGSWPYKAEPARKTFTEIIRAIASCEQVYVAVNERTWASARHLEDIKNVTLLNIDSDDAWARDIAPTFVKNNSGAVRCVNWEFNAWGGDYDGLYKAWEKDNAFAQNIAEKLNYKIYNAAPFVLEGGSVHSDGEGTLLVTEACLLSKGRNPNLTKEQIEDRLCMYLGAKKIIWLPRGIYNDETNEHVDNMAAFIAPAQAVLAWTDNKNDPQYELSRAALEVLENTTDAKGRKITVHKLPVPDTPICVEGIEGYAFEEGEDTREVGERLAASYVNFYFADGAVVMPVFGGVNEDSDHRAVNIMKRLCPDRKIIPIKAMNVLLGGGNIHCITQQIPMGENR